VGVATSTLVSTKDKGRAALLSTEAMRAAMPQGESCLAPAPFPIAIGVPVYVRKAVTDRASLVVFEVRV